MKEKKHTEEVTSLLTSTDELISPLLCFLLLSACSLLAMSTAEQLIGYMCCFSLSQPDKRIAIEVP